MFWKRKIFNGIFFGMLLRILLSSFLFLHLGAFQLDQLTQAFTPLVQKAVPAVVHIRADSAKSTQEGSGFFITSKGLIITNAHLIYYAHQIRVTTHLQQAYPATLYYLDPDTDIAVIKIEGTEFPFLNFGNSNELKMGQLALGIGYTISNNPSISLALINAIHIKQLQLASQGDFIQTQALIHLGNSGGPLLNAQGEVIGIHTATLLSENGNTIGISFVLSSNSVKESISNLKLH